ncbi:transcriptional regulator, TetR family [Catenulispora acidiphila DSM 44928]|uniref:Transcriptional regulator, TetR family n=1 Tax=Catenulispora acidiphila (strain DSM 44928 / JCM 14897 / NBRC 102108 / NRRL B-24433 / ID139908) TaxID=479433 RepID=C7QEV3_CATAD|nr:TetR/AcrR family transcriptional regulator [Catenulispora acidiphila]ACU72873.1 transcriptional regulator, TetR family [Catenulispora acidiphila DSM 44928]
MPRISPERRAAKRGDIIAAARRCFSRDGFHQTSMPEIAAEAGLSAGAPYRYFASKEEIILAIASDAFRLVFEPVQRLAEATDAPTVADLVAAALRTIEQDTVTDAAGRMVPVEELLRCAVQTWSEILRSEEVRDGAVKGFEGVHRSIAEALRRGQAVGSMPATVDADLAARTVMGLLHGMLLQRVAFGAADAAGLADGVQAVLRQ